MMNRSVATILSRTRFPSKPPPLCIKPPPPSHLTYSTSRCQFRTTASLRSRDNFTKKRSEDQKAASNNHRAAEDSRPKTRSGIRYADGPTPVNGITPNLSPHSVANTTSDHVVFSSQAEYKASLETERAALGIPAEAVKRPTAQAESLLVTFNRIRVNPIYRFTRVFAVGSSLVMLSERIRGAESLPEEYFDAETPYIERIEPIYLKSKRIIWLTLERVWSPWESLQSADESPGDDSENIEQPSEGIDSTDGDEVKADVEDQSSNQSLSAQAHSMNLDESSSDEESIALSANKAAI